MRYLNIKFLKPGNWNFGVVNIGDIKMLSEDRCKVLVDRGYAVYVEKEKEKEKEEIKEVIIDVVKEEQQENIIEDVKVEDIIEAVKVIDNNKKLSTKRGK